MHFVLFLLALLLLSPQAVAAPTGVAQVFVSSEDVLRGRFIEEKNLKGFNAPVKSEGHFIVSPKQGLIWATERPFAITTAMSANGLAQSIKGVRVMHLPAQKIPFMKHLYETLKGALMGDWSELEKDFELERKETGAQWQVELVPTQRDNPAMPFETITVRGSRFVESVVMRKADGDSDTLTFFDVKASSGPLVEAEKRELASVTR